jgi:hypothetical protein
MMVLDNGQGKSMELPRVTLVRGEERCDVYVKTDLEKLNLKTANGKGKRVTSLIPFNTKKNKYLMVALKKEVFDSINGRPITVWLSTKKGRSEGNGGSLADIPSSWNVKVEPVDEYRQRQVRFHARERVYLHLKIGRPKFKSLVLSPALSLRITPCTSVCC